MPRNNRPRRRHRHGHGQTWLANQAHRTRQRARMWDVLSTYEGREIRGLDLDRILPGYQGITRTQWLWKYVSFSQVRELAVLREQYGPVVPIEAFSPGLLRVLMRHGWAWWEKSWYSDDKGVLGGDKTWQLAPRALRKRLWYADELATLDEELDADLDVLPVRTMQGRHSRDQWAYRWSWLD